MNLADTIRAAVLVLAGATPALAQPAEAPLMLELNGARDVNGACRLTFVAQNTTGSDIEKLVFETVVIDTSGSVVRFSLFDFRELPQNRPRVRQFDLTSMSCDSLGQMLINGANTCIVAGADSPLCQRALSLSSRIDVELLG